MLHQQIHIGEASEIGHVGKIAGAPEKIGNDYSLSLCLYNNLFSFPYKTYFKRIKKKISHRIHHA